MISTLDISETDIELSSPYTVGPVNADKSFIDLLASSGELPKTTHIVVDLYGSLSLTGKGHATDIAIMMGLASNNLQDVNIDSIAGFTQEAARIERLPVAEGTHTVDFSPSRDIPSHAEALPRHKNGMRITAWNDIETLLSETYYSVGGGFIVEGEQSGQAHDVEAYVSYNFHSASELLKLCERNGLSVFGLMMQNGLVVRSKEEIDAGFVAIWDAVHAGIERDVNTEDALPGPLNIPYRIVALCRLLVSSDNLSSDPTNAIDWVNMSALIVSEENAAGRRVVTASTNGACGIIPATLAYYDKFRHPVNINSIIRYLLAMGAIGALYKMNAPIFDAEIGCQGEIGVARSVAAAGLTELLGGSPSQTYIAAEIAMEYNLGLACDPVAEQVQIPRIEHNAINAMKAINAVRTTLRRMSELRVSFDKVIKTMYEMGKDMNDKYRKMLRGGLAIRVVCTRDERVRLQAG